MINIKKKFNFFIIIIFLIVLTFPQISLATKIKDLYESSLRTTGGPDGAGYNVIALGGAKVSLVNRVGNIISVILGFLGVIFLLLMIYGGFKWMTARGDEANVRKAKDIITHALIGLIIVVAAFAISYFVVYSIGQNALK